MRNKIAITIAGIYCLAITLGSYANPEYSLDYFYGVVASLFAVFLATVIADITKLGGKIPSWAVIIFALSLGLITAVRGMYNGALYLILTYALAGSFQTGLTWRDLVNK